ncbi:hypothetical protein EZS27_027058 [termite gut metagenome]|uniref:Uncharacterized protein n=1 Tax=termite gut metagenome TaxID=433724 RepID=A0A5J4QQV6_9ZZZZ
MEKKFMKYLLFGVFTFVFSVAFVGCGEDYDSDIDDLKKADVATLQAAKEAVAAAQTALQSQITGVETTAAAKAVAEAKTAALTEVATQLDKLKVGDYSLDEVAEIVGQVEALGLESLSNTVAELKELLDDESTIEGIKNVAALKLQVDALEKYLEGYKDGDPTVKEEIEALRVLIASGIELTPEQATKIVEQLLESGLGELITLQVEGLITGISIVKVEGITSSDKDLIYTIVPAAADDYTFGEGLGGAIKFEKNKVRPEAATLDVILKVTPANATLEGKHVYLVNSKGNPDINGYITPSDPVRYNDLLTRAADATSTGLYKVSFTVNSTYSPDTKDAFKLLTYKDNNNNGKIDSGEGSSIAFAIAVDGKPLSGSEIERPVLSEFETAIIIREPTITYTTPDVVEVDDNKLISFNLDKSGKTTDGFPVKNIKNNYSNNSGIEYIWKSDKSANNGNPQNLSAKQLANDNDARYLKEAYQVSLKEGFDVRITGANFVSGKALAFYIDLDWANAGSKKALWEAAIKSNGITGIDKVYSLADAKPIAPISIISESLENETIGFRLFVVNHDGTLVDPDGRAFYVLCGEKQSDVPNLGTISVTTNIYDNVPTRTSAVWSNEVVIPWNDPKVVAAGIATNASNVFGYKLSFEDDALKDINSIIAYADVTGGGAGKYLAGIPEENDDYAKLESTSTAWSTSLSSKKIIIGKGTSTSRYDPIIVPSKLEEGKTYKGTLQLLGANEKVLGEFTINLKKVLPTKFPTFNGTGNPLGGFVDPTEDKARISPFAGGKRFFVPIKGVYDAVHGEDTGGHIINVNSSGIYFDDGSATAGTVSKFKHAAYSIKDVFKGIDRRNIDGGGDVDYRNVIFSLSARNSSNVETTYVGEKVSAGKVVSDILVKISDINAVKENTEYRGSIEYDYGYVLSGEETYKVPYDNSVFTVLFTPDNLYRIGVQGLQPQIEYTYNAAEADKAKDVAKFKFTPTIKRRLSESIFTDINQTTYDNVSRSEFEKYYDLQTFAGAIKLQIIAAKSGDNKSIPGGYPYFSFPITLI